MACSVVKQGLNTLYMVLLLEMYSSEILPPLLRQKKKPCFFSMEAIQDAYVGVGRETDQGL